MYPSGCPVSDRTCTTALFFLFHLLQGMSKTIHHPIGNKKAGFYPVKNPCFGFGADLPVIREKEIMSAVIRPVR